MSERHSERLYQRLIEGGELSHADRRHVDTCDACRRAVADAGRLDQRLEVAASSIVTEPLPPGLLDQPPPERAGQRWQVVAAVIAVAVIAASSIGPVRNLLVADASPTAQPAPSTSPTESPSPTMVPTPTPSPSPSPVPPGDTLGGAWRQTADPPIGGRTAHRMVWTGSEVLVWGGIESTQEASTFDVVMPAYGAAYDPVADSWRRTSAAPVDGRMRPVMAWSGQEMLVWGGEVTNPHGYVADGAAYDPASDDWRRLPAAPLSASEAVGGWLAGRFVVVTDTGAAAYEPQSDSWQVLPDAPVRPGWRSAVVVGERMVVIAFGDGATGQPEGAVLEGDDWTSVDVPLDPLDAGVEFVSGGDLMLVPSAGLAFDPTAGWRTTVECPEAANGGAWTGSYLIGVGAAYDPVQDRCLDIAESPPRAAPFDGSNGREFAVGVWTGTEYVTWSGGNYGDIVWVPNDGAVFTPSD